MANRTDNFNRADSVVTLDPPSDGGGNYLVAAGTWGITANRAYIVTAANPIAAVLNSTTVDVLVEVTIATLGANDIGGLCARYIDINNHWMFYLDGLNNKTRLYKFVAGSFVPVIDTVGAPASGDVLALGFLGDAWTAYRNGSPVGSGTDSFANTGTRHGLWGYATSTDTRWDTLSVTDAGAGGGLSIPVAMNQYRQRRNYLKRRSGLWTPKSFCEYHDNTRAA